MIKFSKAQQRKMWADMITRNVEHVNEMRLAKRIALVTVEIGTLFIFSVWSLIFLVQLL